MTDAPHLPSPCFPCCICFLGVVGLIRLVGFRRVSGKPLSPSLPVFESPVVESSVMFRSRVVRVTGGSGRPRVRGRMDLAPGGFPDVLVDEEGDTRIWRVFDPLWEEVEVSSGEGWPPQVFCGE